MLVVIGDIKCEVSVVQDKLSKLYHAELLKDGVVYGVTGIALTAKGAEILGNEMIERYQSAIENKKTDSFGQFVYKDFTR